MELPPADTDEYITDFQFCSLVRVSPRTSQQWRTDGTGPTYTRLGARRIIYKRSDVNAWLAARSFQHRAAEATGRSKAA